MGEASPAKTITSAARVLEIYVNLAKQQSKMANSIRENNHRNAARGSLGKGVHHHSGPFAGVGKIATATDLLVNESLDASSRHAPESENETGMRPVALQ